MPPQTSVGVVETLGVVPLLATLEAMVKSADLELVTVQKIGGGYMVMAVRGHLSSVNSAMEVARATLSSYGDGRYTQIYARPHNRAREVLTDPLGNGSAALESGSLPSRDAQDGSDERVP